jgi:hypothetical protein
MVVDAIWCGTLWLMSPLLLASTERRERSTVTVSVARSEGLQSGLALRKMPGCKPKNTNIALKQCVFNCIISVSYLLIYINTYCMILSYMWYMSTVKKYMSNQLRPKRQRIAWAALEWKFQHLDVSRWHCCDLILTGAEQSAPICSNAKAQAFPMEKRLGSAVGVFVHCENWISDSMNCHELPWYDTYAAYVIWNLWAAVSAGCYKKGFFLNEKCRRVSTTVSVPVYWCLL